MIAHFDHRFASAVTDNTKMMRQGKAILADRRMHEDAFVLAQPRYWVDQAEVAKQLAKLDSPHGLLCFMDVTSASNHRTAIPVIIPPAAIVHKLPIAQPTTYGPRGVCFVTAAFASFPFDYLVRQKLGGVSLTYFVLKQCAVPSPTTAVGNVVSSHHSETALDWVGSRVLELSYTAWDLLPFSLDYGYSGPPFRWDEERRFLLRCELDAAFFHLYLLAASNGDWRPAEKETAEDLARLKASFPTPRDAVAYIMDTFPIVKRKDEAAHGEYRTKRVILEIYDAMAEATRTGIPYQTRLDPPPADPRCAHPNNPPTWLTATAHAETPAPPRNAQEQIQPVSTVPRATHAASPASASTPPLSVASVTRPQAPFTATGTDQLPSVLEYLKANPGPRAKAEILAAIGIPDTAWPDLSRRLVAHPDVEKIGERRGTRYSRQLR
jgi:hypothetical protein